MHAIVFVLSLLQTPSQDGPPVYRNDTYGFELVVPPGWVQVPDSVLRNFVLAARRMGAPEQAVNYPTAFAHASGPDWFAPPYVLVQVNEFAPGRPAPPSLVQVAADLTGFGNSARYDAGREAVLVASPPMPTGPGTSLRSWAGIRLSRRGLVSVMAYGREGDTAATAAIRDRFLDGLGIDSPPEPSGPAVYRDDEHGFHVAAPAGWVPLPDSVVRAMRARTQQPYVAAFAPEPLHATLGYPYVLVQLKEFAPDDMPPGLDSVAAALNALPPGPAGNRPLAHVDSTACAVLVVATPGRLADGRLISAYGAMRLVRRGVASVTVYGLASDSAATAAIQAKFLAGFAVDSGAGHP